MNFNEIIKDINTMSQLSTAEYESLGKKLNSLVYFKKKQLPIYHGKNKENEDQNNIYY